MKLISNRPGRAGLPLLMLHAVRRACRLAAAPTLMRMVKQVAHMCVGHTRGVTCGFMFWMNAPGNLAAVAISRKPEVLQLTHKCPCSVAER